MFSKLSLTSDPYWEVGRGDAGPLLQGHGARQHGARPGPGQVPPGA